MTPQRRTAITFPHGRKLTMTQEPLAPEIFIIKWGRVGNVALVDTEQKLIEIDPLKVPEDVSFVMQLFIADQLNLDVEQLREYDVDFQRVQ